MQSSVICLKNIPYGFYEKQLNGFFSQYGNVKRVRVLRSKQVTLNNFFIINN